MKKRYNVDMTIGLGTTRIRWPILSFSDSFSLPSRVREACDLLDRTRENMLTNQTLALLYINRALSLFPNMPELLNQRCLTFMGFRNYPAALEDIDRVIKLAPKFFGPYLTQGNIRFLLRNPEGAYESFYLARRFAENDKQQALALFQLGILLDFHELHDVAKKTFQTASDLDPGNEKYAFAARARRITPEELEEESRKIVVA